MFSNAQVRFFYWYYAVSFALGCLEMEMSFKNTKYSSWPGTSCDKDSGSCRSTATNRMLMTTTTTLPRRHCTSGPGAELMLLSSLQVAVLQVALKE